MTESGTPLSLRNLLMWSLPCIGDRSWLLLVEMESWCKSSHEPPSWLFPFKEVPDLVGVDLPESCLDLGIDGVRAPLIDDKLV